MSTIHSTGTSEAQLLTPGEAARLISCSPETLEFWRAVRKGPRYTALGPGVYFYRKEDLDAWRNPRPFRQRRA